MTQGPSKKVDESWKESIDKEKASPSAEPVDTQAPPETDFLGFIATLAMQASAVMDEAQGLPQARYLIDILQLLSDKTKNNLSSEEELELKNVLYGLRVKFVKKSQETAE